MIRMSKAKCSFLDLDYSSGEGEEKSSTLVKVSESTTKQSQKKKVANDLRAEVFGRPKKVSQKITAAAAVVASTSDLVCSRETGAAAAATAAFRLEQSRLESYQTDLTTALAASLALDPAASGSGSKKGRNSTKKPACSGGRPTTSTTAIETVERVVREEIAKERMVVEIEEERHARLYVGRAEGSGSEGGPFSTRRLPPGLPAGPISSTSPRLDIPHTVPAGRVSASSGAEPPRLCLLTITDAASLSDPGRLLQQYALALSEIQRLKDENAALSSRLAGALPHVHGAVQKGARKT